MNRRFLIVLCVLAGATGGLFAAVRSGFRLDQVELADFLPPDEHRVTDAMLVRSAALDDRPSPSVHAPGLDGRSHSIEELASNRPLVLVFIKRGCPCSADAQAYFNR